MTEYEFITESPLTGGVYNGIMYVHLPELLVQLETLAAQGREAAIEDDNEILMAKAEAMEELAESLRLWVIESPMVWHRPVPRWLRKLGWFLP